MTGLRGSGRGHDAAQSPVGPAGAVIVSADNESNQAVEFGDGTCAKYDAGDPKDKAMPKTKENLPDKVDTDVSTRTFVSGSATTRTTLWSDGSSVRRLHERT
jgi:hypothetical protein